MNLRIFYRSRCRRRRRCLSPPLLWSKHFAIIVTWRHISPLYIFSVMSYIVDLKVWQKKLESRIVFTKRYADASSDSDASLITGESLISSFLYFDVVLNH